MEKLLAVRITTADEMQNPDVQVLAARIRADLTDGKALKGIRNEEDKKRRLVLNQPDKHFLGNPRLPAEVFDFSYSRRDLAPPAPDFRWRDKLDAHLFTNERRNRRISRCQIAPHKAPHPPPLSRMPSSP